MSRPADWSALNYGKDPVGGDPVVVRSEASAYGRTGRMIADQAAALRTIGSTQELVGDYATELRTAADELREHLDKVHGRYTAVSSLLSHWADELDAAHDTSLRLLREAQDAQADVSRTIAVFQTSGQTPTPAQADAAEARAAAHEDALEQLAAIRKRMRTYLDGFHERARSTARQIRRAIDDQVEDGFWDDVFEFVHNHADLIKKITEVLSWIATALAVIALFVPGLNLIVLAAIALTAIVLVSHALQAAAGEGSWADVILDVIALATFGIGKIATTGLRAATTVTRSAARTAVTARASQAASRLTSVRAAARGVRGGQKSVGRANEIRIRAVQAVRGLDRLTGRFAGMTAKDSTVMARILHGGETDNVLLALEARLIARLVPTTEVLAAAARAGSSLRTARIAFATGLAGDLGDKFLGTSDVWSGKAAFGPYSDPKKSLEFGPVVSTW